jgi:adenylate cyclase
LEKTLKTFKKILAALLSSFTLGVVVTLIVVKIALNYYANQNNINRLSGDWMTKIIRQVHEKSIDWRMNMRGPQSGMPQIAILAVDEKAIQQEGRWPWPREKIAHLIQAASDAGIRTLAFDAVFSEVDRTTAYPTLLRMRHELEKKALPPEVGELFKHEMASSNSDELLAQTVGRNSSRLVMGAFYNPDDDPSKSRHPFADICDDAFFQRSKAAKYWKKEDVQPVIQDAAEVKVPDAMSEKIKVYLSRLELDAVQKWLEQNPKTKAILLSHLAAYSSSTPTNGGPAISMDPSLAPAFVQLWLLGDEDTITQILSSLANPTSQAAPANNAVTQANLTRLKSEIESSFTQRDLAILNEAVRVSGHSYCGRFLTSRDELLDKEKYKALWTEDQDFADWSWEAAWPEIQKSDPLAAKLNFNEAVTSYKEKSLVNSIEAVESWVTNIPSISDALKHTGFFNAKLDFDGTIRREHLLVRQGNQYLASLALKTFLVSQNYGVRGYLERDVNDDASPKLLSDLSIMDSDGNKILKIPADNEAQLSINYAGPSKMFAYVSAADLLSDSKDVTVNQLKQDEKSGRYHEVEFKEDKKTFFKDKILFFGATAVGINDMRLSPFEENYPGVETHANLLSNLMVEQARISSPASVSENAPGFLKTRADEEVKMWISLLILGIALSALIAHFGSVAGLVVTALTLFTIYAFDRYYLFKSGIVIAIIFPVTLVVLIFFCMTFYKYFIEERKKRELKGTFEKYVSPAIVAEVLSDPSKIELGGRKVELTVFFSDVRGFTTISEKLDPRQLSDLLNSYLTPMTDLVFANKGTLDKYMGDAVMAFFGAPIHYADHAKSACRCALQSLSKLAELQAEYRRKGLPEIDIGIGLNTGEVSVGNMGSNTVRSYTVMGDAVNLGSRLEGINKQYGTRIILSEFTQKHIKEDFVTREIDWVRVKGKADPVRIFELMGEKAVASPVGKMLERFNAGFSLYHEGKFELAMAAFHQALSFIPGDGPSQLYVERCQEYLEVPPQEGWDGVFTMTSK